MIARVSNSAAAALGYETHLVVSPLGLRAPLAVQVFSDVAKSFRHARDRAIFLLGQATSSCFADQPWHALRTTRP